MDEQTFRDMRRLYNEHAAALARADELGRVIQNVELANSTAHYRRASQQSSPQQSSPQIPQYQDVFSTGQGAFLSPPHTDMGHGFTQQVSLSSHSHVGSSTHLSPNMQRRQSQRSISTAMSRSTSHRSEASLGPQLARQAQAYLVPHSIEKFIAQGESKAGYRFHGTAGQGEALKVGQDPIDFLSNCPSMGYGSSAAEDTQSCAGSSEDISGARLMSIASSHAHDAEDIAADYATSPYSDHSASFSFVKQGTLDQAVRGVGADLLVPLCSVPMERSTSNNSLVSVRSAASHRERRSAEALQRTNSSARATVILPKPQHVPALASSISLGGRLPVTKARGYKRPKHPRVKCEQCNEKPDGFRGEHELKRHVNAKHKGLVQKWVCRDPAESGHSPRMVPVNPLSNCKACKNGKEYGAYYNAAAHLRRTHFKPKPSRSEAGRQKRAGMGGDWPPMEDLRPWFMMITVAVDASTSIREGSQEQEQEQEGLDVVLQSANDSGSLFPSNMDPEYQDTEVFENSPEGGVPVSSFMHHHNPAFLGDFSTLDPNLMDLQSNLLDHTANSQSTQSDMNQFSGWDF